jgi:hypothetical protein
VSVETYQIDLFTGELVDNRTRKQKARDRQAAQPRTAEMFNQRDLAQFGVRARPLMPIAPTTKLALAVQDPRTPEERERDEWLAATGKTYRLTAE